MISLNGVPGEEVKKDINAMTQASRGTIQSRCSNCGLEWESAHYAEECPLSELEKVFLTEDWFMGSSEANDECR
jgi:hypothetical protein